ncbi:MAG: hypothetical protein JXR94_17830 [Candidatus Hydrogenedentes bacterium]|nr:hypothetical protein [Candidatus Hydrogenedentota bacterium]
MKHWHVTFTVAAALALGGCATGRGPHRAVLRCEHPFKGSSFVGGYSFSEGMLTSPVSESGQVDLLYYFDGDDCSQGALVGDCDALGCCLLPIGHKPWPELVKLEPPSQDAEWAEGITPLTKEQEGWAFWVRCGPDEFVVVRLERVRPANYDDLVGGAVPSLELKWYGPLTR